MLVRRAQEVGGHHRRDETRDEQREHDGDRHRQAELTEVLPGDAAHEAHRREDRRDRERDCDHREPDLVGGLERSAIGGLAHAHMADDVLDLDDRVVDQNAGHERNGEEAHEVEREADRVHRPEGGDNGQRQRNRGDERGAHVAQEDEHDDDGESRALDQRLHGRMIIADLAVDLGVDLGEFHLRMRGLDFLQPLCDQRVDRHVACALGAGHAEGDDRLVEQAGEGARFGRAVGDGPELVEADPAPAWQSDRQRGQIFELSRASQRADRLFLAGELAPAAAEIDIVGPHLLVDGRRGDAESKQPLRIERDADLPIDPAEALDLADAMNALQVACDRVVDQPRQLLDRKPRRRGGVSDDRQTFDIDAADDRLVDGARQIGADLGDLILHVVEGAVDIDRADRKLHDCRRRSVGDGRNDVPDAVDAGDGVLDFFRHLRLKLRRRGARLGDEHLNDRNVDVRKPGDRHRPEADQAENRQNRERNDRRDGLADRPGGDVEAHRRVP